MKIAGDIWMVYGDTRWGTQLDTLEDIRRTRRSTQTGRTEGHTEGHTVGHITGNMEGRTERRTAGRTEERTVACQDGNWGDTWKVHGDTRWGTRLDAEEDIGRTRRITQRNG